MDITEREEAYASLVPRWNQLRKSSYPHGWHSLEEHGLNAMDLETIDRLVDAYIRKRTLERSAVEALQNLADGLAKGVPRLPSDAKAYFAEMADIALRVVELVQSDPRSTRVESQR